MHVTPSAQLLQALSNVTHDRIAPGRTPVSPPPMQPARDVATVGNPGLEPASAAANAGHAGRVEPSAADAPMRRGSLVDIVV